MLWIGITGSIGSGKSSAAKVLKQMGYPVLDADQVVHGLLAPGSPVEAEVLGAFGAPARGGDGHLDRRALGRIVFGQPALLKRLEDILHPRVRERVALLRAELAAAGHTAAFYDVPLLFEKNMESLFDGVIVVSAPRELAISRFMSRTGLSRAEVEARVQAQLDPALKEARASAVVRNDGDWSKLEHELRVALKVLKVPAPIVVKS